MDAERCARPAKRAVSVGASALPWLLLALSGAALVWFSLSGGGGAVLVRPGLLCGLVAVAIGVLNALGRLAMRHARVLPDPGGRLWA